jgi:DnaJ-class molecular chaperone
MEKQDPPKKPVPTDTNKVECPLCKGYGQYHYGDIQFANGQYQMMHCGQCNGYGYVTKGSVDETCVPHQMKWEAKLGRCYNRYKCEKCGKVHNIDSSD